MSENTEGLIAEAREFLRSENAQYYDSSLIGALADALEAATRERDAATEIERYKDAAEGNRIRLVHAQNDAERFEAERDAALEVMSNHKCGENVEAAYRRAVNAEARIAELKKSRDRWEELCGKIASEKYDLNARIAELEADMERCEGLKAAHMRSVHETVTHNEELLARIAEAAKLHRKRRAFADDWDTCTCGYDAFPCPTAVALGLNEGETGRP